ncbi:unnamed protein product [Arctia plantaginis]|uniref:Uncharacterized protein n=1 Tax=Arctia plantaginis TaxID=874455 RepID=A0A8S0YS89_ARCPL|nr:unnamed protein product [Arctia plantaginis]
MEKSAKTVHSAQAPPTCARALETGECDAPQLPRRTTPFAALFLLTPTWTGIWYSIYCILSLSIVIVKHNGRLVALLTNHFRGIHIQPSGVSCVDTFSTNSVFS